MRYAKHAEPVSQPTPVEEKKPVSEYAASRTVFTADPNVGSPITFITDQVDALIEVDTEAEKKPEPVKEEPVVETVEAEVVTNKEPIEADEEPVTNQGEFKPTDVVATAVLDSIFKKTEELENQYVGKPMNVHDIKEPMDVHLPTNTPVINQMISDQSDENARKIDDMVDMLSDALEYFIDKESDLLTPNLDTKQVDDVLNFMIELQTKYFSEIPLTHRMSRPFLFGIPEKLYDEMEESIDHGESIVFNPMTYLYIMLVEEPRFAIGKFLKILTSLAYDQQNMINRYAAEYDEATRIDNEDDEEDVSDFIDVDDEDE
jgi:hypothetical protein